MNIESAKTLCVFRYHLRVVGALYVACLFLLSCCAPMPQRSDITQVELYYVRWLSTSDVRMTPAVLMLRYRASPKSVQYQAIDDYEYCSSLSERLGRFAGSRIDGIHEIDSRLLLILHHTTRQPDTLSFNRQLMTHNGIVYHVDSSMLRVAIAVLPEGEKRTILKDLNQ